MKWNKYPDKVPDSDEHYYILRKKKCDKNTPEITCMVYHGYPYEIAEWFADEKRFNTEWPEEKIDAWIQLSEENK